MTPQNNVFTYVLHNVVEYGYRSAQNHQKRGMRASIASAANASTLNTSSLRLENKAVHSSRKHMASYVKLTRPS